MRWPMSHCSTGPVQLSPERTSNTQVTPAMYKPIRATNKVQHNQAGATSQAQALCRHPFCRSCSVAAADGPACLTQLPSACGASTMLHGHLTGCECLKYPPSRRSLPPAHAAWNNLKHRLAMVAQLGQAQCRRCNAFAQAQNKVSRQTIWVTRQRRGR